MRKEIRPEKLRDMVCSILPSKNREAAGKAKRLVKRKVRRTVRNDLRFVDFELTKRDLLRDAEIDVRWRRDGDKLNHFLRWCEAITHGMSHEAALAAVRRILPRNLIGDHAYAHWEQHRRRRRYSRRNFYARRQQSAIDSARFHLARALRDDPGVQRRINDAIKARKQEGEPRRLLLGIHDADEFVRDVVTGEEFAIEESVLEQLTRGGRKRPPRVIGFSYRW